MSYILDALRRADAERERGHVPGINAQPAWSGPTTAAGTVAGAWFRRRDAVLIAGVLLLVSIAWLAWRAFGQEATGARPATASGEVSTAGMPPPNTGPALAVLKPGTATTAGPAVAATADFGSAPKTADASGRATGAEIDRPSPPRTVTPRTAADSSLPERPTSAGRTETARPSRKPASTTAATATAAGNANPAPSDTSPLAGANRAAPAAPPAKVMTLDELPEEVRRDIPRLAVGGAIYSESPASRFVILNGQLFHEGEAVAPGVVLQQIKLRSAVLGVRGYRYSIAL